MHELVSTICRSAGRTRTGRTGRYGAAMGSDPQRVNGRTYRKQSRYRIHADQKAPRIKEVVGRIR